MDAKAKVVAWQLLDIVGDPVGVRCAVTGLAAYKGLHNAAIPLIPLTDHEAALAELAEENAASEAIWSRKCDELDARLQTLRSGLEALAGGWDGEFADDKLLNAQSRAYASELRDRLASSATGEKNTEEGNG